MADRAERGVIEAAGGLVWRDAESGPELLLVYRPRRDDWTLPKGHLKPGETWQQAALREVREETGYTARITGYAGCTTYLVEGVPKVVLFWNMVPDGEGRFEPNKEVDKVMWLSAQEALDKLDYDSERRLVRDSAERLWSSRFHPPVAGGSG